MFCPIGICNEGNGLVDVNTLIHTGETKNMTSR